MKPKHRDQNDGLRKSVKTQSRKESSGRLLNSPIFVLEFQGRVGVNIEREQIGEQPDGTFLYTADRSYAEADGRRVPFQEAGQLATALNGKVVTVRFVKENQEIPMSRAQALDWFANRLRRQLPPSFRDEISITVQEREGRQP